MSIIEKAKRVAGKLIQPLLEKPPQRISWQSYGRWRTFSHKDGRVSLRRYKEQPDHTEIVGNSTEAVLLARQLWGVEIDTRGKPPAPRPALREPLLPSINPHPARERPYRIAARPVRITPRTPRLR